MGEMNIESHNTWVKHSIDSHPFRSKVKVMGEMNVKSHNMGPIFY